MEKKGTNKHIPQRTCIACRQVKDKRQLVRLVRVSDSSVEVDPGGGRAGRGAYLCPSVDCWQEGLKGRRLERALGATLSQDNRRQLGEYGKGLSKE